MTGWEEFTGRRVQPWFVIPAVTITADGVFYLSSAAVELLGDPRRVALLWDAGQRRIGMRPSSEATPHSYALTTYQRAGAGQIAAWAFLTRYGLLDLIGQTLPAHLEGDVLVVPLAPATDAGTAVQS